MLTRPVTTVVLEALFIGILNASLFYGLKTMNLILPPQWILVLCGALIHIIFEYTGGNEWWCRQTYKCL
jgi:hypothetical protein